LLHGSPRSHRRRQVLLGRIDCRRKGVQAASPAEQTSAASSAKSKALPAGSISDRLSTYRLSQSIHRRRTCASCDSPLPLSRSTTVLTMAYRSDISVTASDAPRDVQESQPPS
jgi:hypothetical protein